MPVSSTKAADLDCNVFYPGLLPEHLPVLSVIRCPFAGSEQDNIYVYDQNEDMVATGEWQTSVDFDDDLWIFDAGGNGFADLIIDFHQDGTRLVADLYDDQNQDGQVSYQFSNGKPAITESNYPTIRVTAPDGWWQKKDKINYNLQVEVDGPTRATFATFDRIFPDLKTDGKTDYTIHIKDTDQDGRPDYEIRQVLLPVPAGGGNQTELMVNTNHQEIPPAQDFLFWPYLGQPPDYIKPYGEGYPPILVDWENSHIKALTEFVASRGQEANWFIYSQAAFGRDGEDYANFENPFAFYDLANDQDGHPELIIRSEYAGPNDPMFLKGFYSQPIEAIRYSWDQDNDNDLDYKVDLLGRHPIDQVVSFPEFSVRTIPYEIYPNWVSNQPWDMVHFIAVEQPGYRSSEGIYEGFTRDWRDYYLTGLTSQKFLDQVSDIRAGLRNEYTLELQERVWLYFSPVDKRLHLKHASGGIWNIDVEHRMRYTDLNEDGYLDQWKLTIDKTSNKEADPSQETTLGFLQVFDNFILTSTDNSVSLVNSAPPQKIFETLPPTNHAEWQELNNQLEAAQGAQPLANLSEMGSQFSGPTTQISGASIKDIEIKSDGYQFTLHLAPGFQVESNDNNLPLSKLPAGDYRVSYDGTYQIQPLTPARLELPAAAITVDPEKPIQASWSTIKYRFENSGSTPINELPFKIYTGRGSEEPRLLKTGRLSIAGESEQILSTRWWPDSAGKWKTWVEIDPEYLSNQNISSGTLSAQDFDIQPAAPADMFAPVKIFDGIRLTWPVALLLLAIGLACFSGFGIVLYTHRLNLAQPDNQSEPDNLEDRHALEDIPTQLIENPEISDEL